MQLQHSIEDQLNHQAGERMTGGRLQARKLGALILALCWLARIACWPIRSARRWCPSTAVSIWRPGPPATTCRKLWICCASAPAQEHQAFDVPSHFPGLQQEAIFVNPLQTMRFYVYRQ